MEEATLQSGDYAVKGLGMERRLRIERKSLPDLVGCMTSGRDRFQRELERLAAYPQRIVIVEGSYRDLAAGQYRSRLHPNAAVAAVADWWQEFGVGFLFAHNRPEAQRFAQSFMLNAARDAWFAFHSAPAEARRER